MADEHAESTPQSLMWNSSEAAQHWQRLAGQRASLNQRAAQLEALSPVRILERGYALVFDSSGALIKDATRLTQGDQISARLAKGTFTAEVKETKA